MRPSGRNMHYGSHYLLRLLFAAVATGSVEASDKVGAKLVKLDRLPLRTAGRYVVDKLGERVKWACVNWYGAYSTLHAVGGLEVQPMEVIINRIVDLGFNCVRMMYSTEGYVTNPLVENSTLLANPDLMGLRWLDIFDKTMKGLTDAGLMVILNNHNSKSGWCCHYSQDEGLWYVPEYSEAQWIESLVQLSIRYKNNSLVVAIDLRNEVHDYESTHLTWGDGNPKTDWAAAATRAGNAVLSESPDVIIVVMAMCFGMDLRCMKDKPIQLILPNRTVYQTHNYLEYQLFDNVSKMVGSWQTIRNFTLLILIAFLLLLLLLRLCWLKVGKPSPPKGIMIFSVSLWIGIFSVFAALASWYSYTFFRQFCSVAAESDAKPWLIGSIIVGALSLVGAARGGCLMIRRRPEHRPEVSDAKLGSECPASVPCTSIVPKTQIISEITESTTTSPNGCVEFSQDAAQADVPSERSAPALMPEETVTTSVRGSGAQDALPIDLEAPPAKSAAAIEAQAEHPLVQVQPQQHPEEGRRTVSLDAKAPADTAKIAKGFGSCTTASPLIVKDVVEAVRTGSFANFGSVPPRFATRPHKWDRGLCCGLQCGILTTIIVFFLTALYVFGHIVPTYWWMERHLDGLWGFALEEGHAYTAPVWMGEFGGNVRGQYWLNFVRYLSQRDVDFAYWAINGKKWTEGQLDTTTGNFVEYDNPRWTNETFGLLKNDYETVRHTWKVLDLQPLMESPSRWTPDTYPCDRDFNPSCGAR